MRLVEGIAAVALAAHVLGRWGRGRERRGLGLAAEHLVAEVGGDAQDAGRSWRGGLSVCACAEGKEEFGTELGP